MSYNFLNYDGHLTIDPSCVYDSNRALYTNFSENGEVDGWTYYRGVHTYGCWNGFLFATLFSDYSVIGKGDGFAPIKAEDYYNIRIVMKLNFIERVGDQLIPSKGKVEWRTLSSPKWSYDKSLDFELHQDGEWHTYVLNMGEAQWWQGDISDLRIHPILSNGKDGDEFFIKSIEIYSIDRFLCSNSDCDYYSRYEHNCPGIGKRGYSKSKSTRQIVQKSTVSESSERDLYTIEKGVNDTLKVSMNGYGYESITIKPMQSITGEKLAYEIAAEISKLDVGGYAECDVEYTNFAEFKIYAGNYSEDSTVSVADSALAAYLNFRDSDGNDISEESIGRDPASGFKPLSSFGVKTHQIYGLLEGNSKSSINFDPSLYNIEAGRRDWLTVGLGEPTKDIRGTEDDTSGLMSRSYSYIENIGKTVIDFSHPFNASGRVTKIFAAVTLDTINVSNFSRGAGDAHRVESQLSGAKIMFFRPLKDGAIRVLSKEVDISNRDQGSGKLYSSNQEYVSIDCDIFVNKGDLIGVYNANVYVGKSYTGEEIDAAYYQIRGKASGDLDVAQPEGDGQAGLLIYARSNIKQKSLVLSLDLGKRTNVDRIRVGGNSGEGIMEYNIARCLDINWKIDLFGNDHTTGYVVRYRPLEKAYYNHPNLYYGEECLTDGVKVVPDGLAGESFEADYGNSYSVYEAALGYKDGGAGVIIHDPKYFSVNGDCEWLTVYYHPNRAEAFVMDDFKHDPIAFSIHFPYETEKAIYKSKIYFKERYNFRSFALSYYMGDSYTEGDADDPRYMLFPYRGDGTNTPWNSVTIDSLRYTPERSNWKDIELYIAQNPCIGHMQKQRLAVLEYNHKGDLAYYDTYGGLQYYATGQILNRDQYLQAISLDWTVLEHTWEPIRAKGFRFYCDYHESTKICEFELYCAVEDMVASMDGTVNVLYSSYGNEWWYGKNLDSQGGADVFIGDTPRYIKIFIDPVVELDLSSISVDVSYQDVFTGEKGCEYAYFPKSIKVGKDSIAERIDLKNVYGLPSDLYVDIAAPPLHEKGPIFYSTLTTPASISDPIIGPDAYYKKQEDYILYNYNKNVAINCPVYTLKGLLDGAQAWYSYDGEYSWKYWGELSTNAPINFSNLPNTAISTLNLPVLNRSKWWKIGFFDPRVVITVWEMRVYFDEEEILGVKFYHQKDMEASTPNIDTAPHLQDKIVDGSYYILKGDHFIGFELPEVQKVDKIVIYHSFLEEYENSHNKAGIDKSTTLCIHGQGDHYQKDSIVDESYYEHPIQVVGNGIYCDEEFTEINYSFKEDFSSCAGLIETFDGPDIDTDYWTDLVGVSIIDSKLHITNSGIPGEASTTASYTGDFSVVVDLSIEGVFDNGGWGCYMESNSGNHYFGVGRTYIPGDGNVFASYEYTDTGFRWVSSTPTDMEGGFKLRLSRDGITTSAAVYDGSNWLSIGTSLEALSGNEVSFRLVSDYSPLAQGVTIGKFDNFTIDQSLADWGVNTDYGSEFTCTSGLPTSVSGGWGYYYDMGVADYSYAAGYKIPKVNEYNSHPLDHTYEFTFKFMFQTEEFLRYDGVSDNNYGVAVGIIDKKTVNPAQVWYRWLDYFTGVQVVLRRDNIGIALSNIYNQKEDVYTSLDTTAGPYYCTFHGTGDGSYSVSVWTDGWDGTAQVAQATLNSNLTWWANKVGVGSSYNGYGRDSVGRCTGWVAGFDFSCYKKVYHQKIGTAIKFSGYQDEYIRASYENSPVCNIVREGFDLDTKRWTIDFHIMLNSLPSDEGKVSWIVGSWHPDQPLSGIIDSDTPSSWLFYIERSGGVYKWRFIINKNQVVKRILDWTFYPDLYRWYYFLLCKGPSDLSSTEYALIRDGHTVAHGSCNYEIGYSKADVLIGRGLNGWLDEIRISSDYTLGGGRLNNYSSYLYPIVKEVPTKRYERYYTMSVYNSSDNMYYGKNMDVDFFFDNTYSYHEPFSKWSEKYYTHFAIDFGQRHAIGLVRSFPIDSSYQFTRSSNVLYSSKDTSDPAIAFALSEEDKALSNNFDLPNNQYPINFTSGDTAGANSYTIDGTFLQSCTPETGQEYSKATFNPYFNGDFDVQIDFDLGDSYPRIDSWRTGFEVEDTNNASNRVRLERAYENGKNKFAFWVKDNQSTWAMKGFAETLQSRGTLRLVRTSQTFGVYYKDIDDADFNYFSLYQMMNGYSSESTLSIMTFSNAPYYPKIDSWLDNFIVNYANPIYSTHKNARWIKIGLLNGSGETEIVKNVGIYPDITVHANKDGQYNCSWEPIGSAITSYGADDNIALNATVSGSSEIGVMYLSNLTNGVKKVDDYNTCWGSDSEPIQWVTIHLHESQQIYRVKIYHGYNENDNSGLITDYKIQVSEDNETFTTIFDISNNEEFERTHDLSSPVWAKYVRMYIDGYTSISRYVWVSQEEGFQFWKGALLREIEIFKYYGFEVINSEDNPIIAINLNQRYFIEGHSIVGIDAEDNSRDWSNADSNFTYANSGLSDPQKVAFRPWGSAPSYDKWVAIMRNTATKYPTVPGQYTPQTDMPDYLKHVVIHASTDSIGKKPNPIEYPWMWRSSISKLSYDYDLISPRDSISIRSLKIEYPASTESDRVYYIKGDVFGVDPSVSWRDGLGINLYIDDINNLDMDYGYIYLGGFDGTENRNPIDNLWNWSTLSGTLGSGWNTINLTFLYRDKLEYTELSDLEQPEPRTLEIIDWGSIGLVFRGKGAPFTMAIDGASIRRNHFEHTCYHGYGLYLHDHDIMKVPTGQLDPSSGTVEFFIRPDWNWLGMDNLYSFKYRELFHFGNVSNDVFGASIGQEGPEVYFGHLSEDLNIMTITGIGIEVLNKVVHMAFVFSNDGTGISSDGSTVRVYINNYMVAKSHVKWPVSDNKYFNLFLGGQGVLSQRISGGNIKGSSVDGVLNDLRVYNYCKTDFSDSLYPDEPKMLERRLKNPQQFVEISEDNVTFYNTESSELPLYFKKVPAGDSVSVWVKVKVPKGLTGYEYRMAKVLGSWDVGV